jgi:hypothetical protein
MEIDKKIRINNKEVLLYMKTREEFNWNLRNYNLNWYGSFDAQAIEIEQLSYGNVESDFKIIKLPKKLIPYRTDVFEAIYRSFDIYN